ncbi:hypothetical protein SFC22_06490 [Bacillus altitudinis]|uniref:hypothetical protein n=1 Tax=Bacillus altitudinis TaxID=293387 RepID=UPI00045CE131|nr:hypothetical protein [Bacillus altitudinis]KDE31581.1 hypothetical protein BA79_07291 [Bacillus altitudinis 41KF2b]MEC1043191.1 hypothetical protein [Bacillus altitudinis]MEC1092457.1 hypothetical protein [Bacillus altitudinis]
MNENPIISSVITKLYKQQEKGLQKYGEEVKTSSYDLKGWLEHAQQEAIDFTTYLEAAIQLLEEQVKSKEEMKFYETHEPYYALIKARNIERAMEIYNNDVTADEEKELAESIKEVTALYAATKYSRCTGEDNKTVPIEEVLDDLMNEKEMRLAVDGRLI